MSTITIAHFTDEGEELEVKLPAKYEVCSRCQGEGTHVNPSIDGNGISQEEFDQDPEFQEAYLEGRYDVTCYECGGKRVTLEVDYDACNPAQKKVADEHFENCARRADEAAADRRTQWMEDGCRGSIND